MKAWKNLEKTVAEILGGVRHVRVSYSEKAQDVDHEYYTVECKYRKSLPPYLEECIKYSKFVPVRLYRKIPKLILDGLEQAKSYNPSKTPILALREHNKRLIIGVMLMSNLPDVWNFPLTIWNDAYAVFDLRTIAKYTKKECKDTW